MNKLLSKIWAAWGILVFTSFMFVVLPFYVVGIIIWGQKAIQHIHWASRIWAGYIFMLCGIRTRNVGSEKLDKKQSYVMVSNHLSALDIPLCAVVSRNPFRFLSKAELGKIPVLGWIIRNIYLTVDRSDAKARQESLSKMEHALNEGSSLFIYPEGRRNRGKGLTTKFFDGAFRLAISSGKPMAILVIMNANQLCPPTGFALKPGVIKYEWLDPIDVSGYDLSQLDELKKRVKELIEASLTKHRNP